MYGMQGHAMRGASNLHTANVLRPARFILSRHNVDLRVAFSTAQATGVLRPLEDQGPPETVSFRNRLFFERRLGERVRIFFRVTGYSCFEKLRFR